MAEINVAPKKSTYKTTEHHDGFIHDKFYIDRTTEIIAIYAEGRSLWNKKQC